MPDKSAYLQGSFSDWCEVGRPGEGLGWRVPAGVKNVTKVLIKLPLY